MSPIRAPALGKSWLPSSPITTNLGRTGRQNINARIKVSGAMWKIARKSIPIGFTVASLINVTRDFIAAIFDKQYSNKTSNGIQKAAFNARYWSHLFAEIPGALLATLEVSALLTLPTWASTIVCPILKLAHDWIRERLGVNTRKVAYLDFEDDSGKKPNESSNENPNTNNTPENPYDKNSSQTPPSQENQQPPPMGNDSGQDDKTQPTNEQVGNPNDKMPNGLNRPPIVNFPNGANGVVPINGLHGNSGLTGNGQGPPQFIIYNAPNNITRTG